MVKFSYVSFAHNTRHGDPLLRSFMPYINNYCLTLPLMQYRRIPMSYK